MKVRTLLTIVAIAKPMQGVLSFTLPMPDFHVSNINQGSLEVILPTLTTTVVGSSSDKDHYYPTSTYSSPLLDGISTWQSAAAAVPPTKAEVSLLRQAFAEFYGVNRNLEKSEQLLSQVIDAWQRQPPDEQAGLYRVRGDCYALLGQVDKSIQDYSTAITILQADLAGPKLADPTELPNALLGRARTIKSQGPSTFLSSSDKQKQLQQAIDDYKQALILSSREDWDTQTELLEDGATRNPYAAWEWGTVLRWSGDVKAASKAHLLASQAFDEIGDKARSIISKLDAGIDLAAAGSSNSDQTVQLLKTALSQTKGIEGRDVALLQRVIAKEGEARIALAALQWSSSDQRNEAESALGEACVRLDQLEADALQRNKKLAAMAPQGAKEATTALPTLRYSLDDDINPLDISCYRFRNSNFLTNQLGWPESLRDNVIKLEKLR